MSYCPPLSYYPFHLAPIYSSYPSSSPTIFTSILNPRSPASRPKGGYEAEFSLAPIAPRLSELLGITVPLVADCVGPVVTEAVSKVRAIRTRMHASSVKRLSLVITIPASNLVRGFSSVESDELRYDMK